MMREICLNTLELLKSYIKVFSDIYCTSPLRNFDQNSDLLELFFTATTKSCFMVEEKKKFLCRKKILFFLFFERLWCND